MALAKYNMGSVQNCAHMGDFPSLWPNEFGDSSFEESGGVFTKNLAISRPSSSLGSPSSGQSNGYVFQATSNRPAEEAHSLINFNDRCNSLIQANCSLLSFQQKNRPSQSSVLRGYYSNWDSGYKQMNPKLENLNCLQTANNFNSISDPEMESSGDWLYQGTTLGNSIQEPEKQDSSIHKRLKTALKKQCNIRASTTTKSKPKSSAPAKGPQSVAAKIRRERISERLKILQELVPNASKVDLVTMLEKAISYVKFLQLQVKALATDELWPTQGGKASDISQVKEAIDAILSGQRDRNSSSSSE